MYQLVPRAPEQMHVFDQRGTWRHRHTPTITAVTERLNTDKIENSNIALTATRMGRTAHTDVTVTDPVDTLSTDATTC